jgi:hypothetical protein
VLQNLHNVFLIDVCISGYKGILLSLCIES